MFPYKFDTDKSLKYKRFVSLYDFSPFIFLFFFPQFPKADVKLILEKVRAALKPVYKEFIQLYPTEKLNDEDRIMPYEKLKYFISLELRSNDWLIVFKKY